MSNQAIQTDEAAAEIGRRWSATPRVGLILGTGLGSLVQHIATDVAISYSDVPRFPQATALSHRGRLICGSLGGVPIVTMDGRCHLYEGYSPDQITLPVRVMQRLGVQLLIVSNAAGGLNQNFKTGDVMLIEDHIDFMWRTSTTERTTRPRAARAASPYDRELIEQAKRVARQEEFVAHEGVYVSVVGPNYETRAEYRCFRRLGGDAVGMSTVPEVNVARECGLRVLALSTITNVANPDASGSVAANEVVHAAEAAEPKLQKIVEAIVADTRE